MDRFTVVRRVGAGGMGVVFEAIDRQRRTRVAVKTLRDLDPDGIYYLKREFRALADVAHPNLVQLHELFSFGERWFFTMELVEGVDFLSYVRAGQPPQLLPSGIIYTPPDVSRLRASLRQLAAGVSALHAAGKLHRDIKPSNALVTADGRVVLLDFGLATDVTLTRLYHTLEPRLVGTPAYLAPEQAAAQPLSPASDWYSVGAMLYEALTGVPPFAGSLLEVLTDKQTRDPPSPRALVPSVPADLEALCLALLRRAPAARPNGDEVLRQLGEAEPKAPAVATAGGAPWVGRAEHLRALEEALATTKDGRPAVVFAHGPSGAGKSALLQRFAGQLSQRKDAVVLLGRCYERELVPYRALDNVVDALARHLMGLPPHEAEALLPRDTQALVRVFPVLRRADVLTSGRRPAPLELDPPELRRRAFAALRELLGRIADRHTLVIAIDDLQWGDADSASLLRHLLAPPDAPPALFVFSYRAEDAAVSPCLALLHGADPPEGELGGEAARRQELPIGPLPPEEARALAHALLPSDSSGVERVAEESGGNPFFLQTLAAHVRSGAATGVTLEEALRARLDRLEPPARQLLEVLALAGRPLTREVANRAAGLAIGDEAPVAALRAQHLVRVRGTGDELEVLHDRIRVAVTGAIPPARLPEIHGRLAHALAALTDVDPELLSVHLEGAGDRAAAATEAARAAARADEALAFERAVALYGRALALGAPDVATLRARLGDALANLGRGSEAADTYLQAAAESGPGGALELKRRAAEQLLRVGLLDRGLEALRAVLASLGVSLARTPRRAFFSLVLRRARLRLRGLRYRARDASDIAPQDLTRLDVYWSVATAMAIIDNVRATDFQARHLALALNLGEPYRIARALAAEAAYTAVTGKRARRRSAMLVQEAEAIAVKLDKPFARGWAALAAGMAAYLEGRPAEARVLCERAESVFQGCTGVWWEVGSARLFSSWALFYTGELRELCRRVPQFIAEAEARGDVYNATAFRGSVLSWVWLVDDDPDRADAEVNDIMRRWPRDGFHSQHWWQMVANVNASLYRGDAVTALRQAQAGWTAAADALLLRAQVARVEGHELLGRAALAAATTCTTDERGRLLDDCRRHARRLRAEDSPWAPAAADALEAGVAALSGDLAQALARLAAADRAYDGEGMALHARACRRRAAELRGDSAAVEEVDAWLRAQGVRRPERVAATLTPKA